MPEESGVRSQESEEAGGLRRLLFSQSNQRRGLRQASSNP